MERGLANTLVERTAYDIPLWQMWCSSARTVFIAKHFYIVELDSCRAGDEQLKRVGDERGFAFSREVILLHG